ncbi:hypothetical protein IVA80_03840 [Bradyrhizobium sp. 139]|uniref:hypothetical protein n=1 Tax=Bradyrhizobium sp. 139 TaxID=2782616 RepID=UPI0031FEFDD1|nr:hypothetical protein [Bradyrhizobium sp. 139]
MINDFDQGNKAVGSTAREHDVINVHVYGFASWAALKSLISGDSSGNAAIHLTANDTIRSTPRISMPEISSSRGSSYSRVHAELVMCGRVDGEIVGGPSASTNVFAKERLNVCRGGYACPPTKSACLICRDARHRSLFI